MGNVTIKLIILHGSRAKETHTEKSDFDFGVLSDHELALDELWEITQALASCFSTKEESVDVVDLWVTSPLLQYQIARHGRLIDGKERDFTRFKVLAWRRYMDTAKLRNIRHKVLEKAYG